ncbi:hypothetical protein J2X69_002127 [Algoriphagus sp. 4150]|nr:hypothetical protein [Algoriphagus sp. 4150]
MWCATSPRLNGIGGVYCEDGDIAELAQDGTMSAGVKAYSLDEVAAVRLWEWSEEITGIAFRM